MLQALSLLEAGATEQAYEISGQLEGIAQQMPNLESHRLRTICLLTNAEYERAIQLWEESSQEATRNGLLKLLANLSPSHSPNSPLNWPVWGICDGARLFLLCDRSGLVPEAQCGADSDRSRADASRGDEFGGDSRRESRDARPPDDCVLPDDDPQGSRRPPSSFGADSGFDCTGANGEEWDFTVAAEMTQK